MEHLLFKRALDHVEEGEKNVVDHVLDALALALGPPAHDALAPLVEGDLHD
jgi:hypothetical protein